MSNSFFFTFFHNVYVPFFLHFDYNNSITGKGG